MQEVDRNYYVYLYLKPDGTTFYVGKGKDDRWKYHLNEARKDNTTDKNNLKLNTIRKILKSGQEPIVKFVDSNISEEQAFELEQFLISEIGRIDLGTGTLTNLTNGGEGSSGILVSEDTRHKRRLKMQGELNPNYGRKDTPEMIEAKRQRQLGKKTGPCSETRRENIRKATLGVKKSTTEKMKKPKSKFPCPHCGKLVSGGNMKRWHGDNCKLKDKGGQDAIGE